MTGAVLIVDDSMTVRMSLIELLNAAGLQTAACPTVAEARQALAKEAFALVILDVLLPDGDGVELLQEIRAMPSAAATAVMMLSTEAEVRDRVRGLTTGADEYVGKPYDPTYLVGRARELVHRGSANAPKGQNQDQDTILLIDDSVTYRNELKSALEQATYRVVVAGSGEEGLRIAADLRPSGVVVDGVLPGIDGATFIRRIRLDAALRALPCFLLTGSEDRNAELRALDAGADAFAVKDDNIGVVVARVSAMLRSAGDQSTRRGTTSLQGPKKVLAVDDSETYLQQLAEALRSEGYEIILARSGEEALELLAVQQVDCVLLDLMMPGIGGRETCVRVKSVPVMRDIPIIMLTAVEDRETMIQGLGAGADDYIAKSGDLDLVRARVRAQIRRKQFEDEHRAVREQLLRAEYEANQARTALEVAQTRAALSEQLESKNTELEIKNEELESFSYSVAHDLRAPLRSIDGFSLALLEECGDKLDQAGKEYLQYVRQSTQHMARLIDDLLALSRVTRSALECAETDVSSIARGVAARLAKGCPDRRVDVIVADELVANCDHRLLTIVFENLIGNAWKFTGKRADARIEIGAIEGTKAIKATRAGPRTYFVRDNGAGFDMSYASKLFGVFQRLHSVAEFEGTGIGLATVQRIVRRHGGRIWAEGAVGRGATFYFTLEAGTRARVVGAAPGSARAPLQTGEEVAA
jgi:two-component system, NtrC family, sensor kinase